MDNIKNTMIDRQIVCRGIDNSMILSAFTHIDREDFISPRYKKYSYAEMEIPTSDGGFLLRPYFIAKIINQIVKYKPESLLVIGDGNSYTFHLLQYIYKESCFFLLEKDLFSERSRKFDVILLDSRIYPQSMIDNVKLLLNPWGKILYLLPVQFPLLNLENCSRFETYLMERLYTNTVEELFPVTISLLER